MTRFEHLVEILFEYLFESLHWIVATLGLSETLIVILIGVVGSVYVARKLLLRQPQPPAGLWRCGIWAPAICSIYDALQSLYGNWLFYRMMVFAEAYNEAQGRLYWEGRGQGAVKLSLLGVLGTLGLHVFVQFLHRKHVTLDALGPVPQQCRTVIPNSSEMPNNADFESQIPRRGS